MVRFSPQWPQTFYQTKQLFKLEQKDQLFYGCIYHNDENRTVYTGGAHTDEMCNIYLMYMTNNTHSNQIFRCQINSNDKMIQNFEKMLPKNAYTIPQQPLSQKNVNEISTTTTTTTTTTTSIATSTITTTTTITTLIINKTTSNGPVVFVQDQADIEWLSILLFATIVIFGCLIIVASFRTMKNNTNYKCIDLIMFCKRDNQRFENSSAQYNLLPRNDATILTSDSEIEVEIKQTFKNN
jgi:hypothetical protein